MISSMSRKTAENGSPCAGGFSGNRARTSPGAAVETTGIPSTCSM
jgi:hypothetical protein